MLEQLPILIVEDEPLIALNLSYAVEQFEGRVVGPAPTVGEALAILAQKQVAAAILDANLLDRDITPVALLLAERGVPFVIHTAVTIPLALATVLPNLPLVLKPREPEQVVTRLVAEIRRLRGG